MDGDNLKLKYIIKKSIRIQMRQCRVVYTRGTNLCKTQWCLYWREALTVFK